MSESRRDVSGGAGKLRMPMVLGLLACVAVAVVVCAEASADGSPVRRLLPPDPGAPIAYVALGDSTVEGVGASAPMYNYVRRLHQRLRALYPSARLTNLGRGGATAADVRQVQLARAIALDPTLVTLSVGPNDITKERSLAAYADDIDCAPSPPEPRPSWS